MVTTNTNTKDRYSGNGVTTSFPINFKFLDNSHVRAILIDAFGVETVWTLGTQYSLTGAGEASGTLTVNTTPTDYTPQTGETLFIRSNITATQDTNYIQNDPFPAESHETALDKLQLISNEQNEAIGRSLKFSETSTTSNITFPELEASKLVGVNSTGDGIELKTASELGAVILSDNTPSAIGSASAGTSSEVSRSDHVHNVTTLDITSITTDLAVISTAQIGDLGTPASGNLSNCSNYPAATTAQLGTMQHPTTDQLAAFATEPYLALSVDSLRKLTALTTAQIVALTTDAYVAIDNIGTHQKVSLKDSIDRLGSSGTTITVAESTGNSITSAGLITWNTGLAGQIRNLRFWAVCVTAEYGFSIGAKVPCNMHGAYTVNEANGGWSVDAITPSAVTLRFANNTNPITTIRHDTGAYQNLTNANWTLTIEAEVYS